jgi:hypothetical protein
VNDGFEDYANRCGAEQEPAEDLVLSRLMVEDGGWRMEDGGWMMDDGWKLGLI